MPGNAASSCGIGLALLFDRRRLVRAQEEELGAEQPDALCTQGDGFGGGLGLAEVGEQGHRSAVRQRTGCDRRGRGRCPIGGAVLRTFELFGRRLRRHDAGRGIHDHGLAVHEVLRRHGADDGHDRLLARQDRGVRGRAALGGDQGEHLVEVEQGGVGGREVLRDEHERMPGVGHAGSGHAAQPGDDPLGDVVQVGRALAQVAAHRGEGVAERPERIVHSELGGLSGADARVDLRFEARVLGHHGLRLEHVLCRSAGLRATLLEFAGDAGDGFAHAGRLVGGAAFARGVLRCRQRLRHPCHRALGDPEADPHTAQFGHDVSVFMSVIVYSASWSVESSSLSRSNVFSALSPSATRVT